MNALTRIIEKYIAPPLTRFAQLKYIQIIQKTFISLTGLLIVGSIFLLLALLPIPAYQEFIGAFSAKLSSASGVATGIISILAVIASALATVDYYNRYTTDKADAYGPVMVAVASFFLINPANTVKTIVEGVEGSFKGIPVTYLGATGIFTALIVSVLSVEVFLFLVKKNAVIKMPEGVPPMVTQAFMALIPSFVIVTFWWALRFVFNFDLSAFILGIFEPLISVGDTPISVVIATFMNRLLWTVGINGGTVVNAVGRPIWEAMNIANQELYALNEPLRYTFSGIFIDNYVWTGLAPLAILLLTTKSKRLKALGALALPAALFNIGEPLMFGLPIVLNPLLMIPFVLGYLGLAVASIVLVSINWIAVPVLNVPWITPAPIRTLLSTNGSLQSMIFVIIGWVFIFLVFYPFVKIVEKQDLESIENTEAGIGENA